MSCRVIFATTVFDDVNTGPGIYARYLWKAFRDDANVEFHVVAPSIKENHPRLHSSGIGRSSLDTYLRVQHLTRRIVLEHAGTTIVHGNAAHSMSEFLNYPGRWIVQVNDYVVSEVWRNPKNILRTKGVRRFIALAWRRWQEKKVVHAATAVICNSEFTRKRILEEYGLGSRGQVLTIHKAVDTKSFEAKNHWPDPYPDRPVGARIVFVGTDWRIKGLPDLLRAVDNLSKTHPHTRLIVGGPSRDIEVAEIEKVVAELGIEEHVRLVGMLNREELPALYQHSDVFVLPSHKEAFGVAILEAMAAGLPVIASNTGGIPEIVSDGMNGLTFTPGDSEQLTHCLERIIGHPTLRTEFVKKGFETAQKFDVERMIDSVRSLYGQVAAKSVGEVL